jgi:SnoaL-like domain
MPTRTSSRVCLLSGAVDGCDAAVSGVNPAGMCDAGVVPWVPELFTAPALQRLVDRRRRDDLVAVPYFDGLMAGEHDALVESFAGAPELHDPLRGRVKGVRAFEVFVAESSAWLSQHHARVEAVEHVILEQRGFEEVVLHLDGAGGPVDLPVAIVADRPSGGLIDELRIYCSTWALTGHHASRPALLQPDPEVHESDVVADYRRALATGDVDAVVAAFEADGYTREPAGGEYVHDGPEGLRAFYEGLLSNGGIPLETCAVVDDGRACALEFNVVRWGTPQAGVVICVRGPNGKLAAARVYDDVDHRLGPHG